MHKEYISAEQADAALKIHFKAGKVYAVMGNNTAKPINIKVILSDSNGKIINESNVLIDKYSIYQLVAQKKFTSGYLQVTVNEPGVQFYTFTFGN